MDLSDLLDNENENENEKEIISSACSAAVEAFRRLSKQVTIVGASYSIFEIPKDDFVIDEMLEVMQNVQRIQVSLTKIGNKISPCTAVAGNRATDDTEGMASV